MRLKKLILQGFKSFADRTVVYFDDGITGVVGPNGCGKSNIIDAFRWVMGEQSAKSLRGEKMHDVIFAGSAKRPPLNFAEVSLVFTNIDGDLPIDYSEVMVTRRVYRSGESEYRINGGAVRLKDVQSLFLGSGIGKGSFSTFEQGKIDQVIQYNPIERRFIFEEAAGILRFKQRKKEALHKLERTQSNLERFHDVREEVQKMMATLSKQATVAQKYKDNKLKYESYDKALFVAKWDIAKAKGDEIESRRKNVDDESAKNKNELEALNKIYSEQLDVLKKSEEDHEKAKERVFQAQSRKEVIFVEQRSSEERRKEAEDKGEKLKQDFGELHQRCKSNDQEVHILMQRRKKIEKELKKSEELMSAKEKKMHAAEEGVIELRRKQKGFHEALLHAVEEKNRCALKVKESKAVLDVNQENIKRAKEKKAEMQSKVTECDAEMKARRKVMDDLSKSIDNNKVAVTKINKSIESIDEASQKCQRELQKLQEESSDVKGRRSALMRLREEMAGLSKDTQALLKGPHKDLLQPLYELVTAMQGMEVALATVLRPYAQTLVLKTKKDLKTVLSYAQEKGLKDFSIFCLHDVVERHGEKDVKAKSFMDEIEKNSVAKHFLKSVYTVSSLDEGKGIIGDGVALEAVIGDAYYLDSKAVLTTINKGKSNVFLREAEVKALSKELESLEKKKEALENERGALEKKKIDLNKERTELDHAIRVEEMRLIEANMALQRARSDKENASKEMGRLEEDAEAFLEGLGDIRVEIKSLEKQYGDLERNEAKQRRLASDSEGELEKRSEALGSVKKEYLQCDSEYKKALDSAREVVNTMKLYEVKAGEWKKQQDAIKNDLSSLDTAKKALDEQEKKYRQRQKDVEQDLKKAEKESEQLLKRVIKSKETSAQTHSKVTKLQEKGQKLQEKYSTLEVQVARDGAAKEAIEAGLQERYQMTMEDIRALGLSICNGSVENTEKEVRRLRNAIEGAGDINMASIEEFEQQKVRHEFLQSQVGDLEKSQKELLKIISTLDKESRRAFRYTFQAVRRNFKKNFIILFGGGESDLKLAEGADILEAGIEIIAQPPGKQMRSIGLLSGGEKCMTAMALLFAIFEVKPAPFCLLDEIDAPLDDSNVDRFVNVLRQFIEHTQFIVVTHNKRTMAIADILFGVSMQERGVSKLLSLEFKKKKDEKHKKDLATVY